MEKQIKFEDQMKKLQEIVDQLERNDVDLDTSISLYQQGLELSHSLKEQLKAFEEKIVSISKGDEDE